MSPNPLPSRNAQPFAKTARPYSPGAWTGSKRKLLAFGGVAAVLLIGLSFGVAWVFGYFHQNPLLAEIDRLRAQMQANGGQPWDAQNRELGNEIRQKIEALPPELQAEFQKQMRDRMMKQGGPQFGKAIEDFFNLSPAEQLAALDKALQENLERQKQWGGMFGGGPGQPGSGDKSSSTASPSGGTSSAPPPGHPPFGGHTDAQRLQFQEQMKQNMPPDMRAQFTVWHQMMQARATQLGLPPSAAWGPPPGMAPPH